ncbi:hypothetical protein LWE61_09920 [Sphingobium sufflavum]|uniref:hypothetical protein n=1 Tax=Sphingobium sufflavum TaxID=1129547 RepID=UPI001F20FB32|nr:hypothetical protein [Sphingobium sufflavum]MCE7796874.1 hypothetical protein [Sphingobium sufflavum]
MTRMLIALAAAATTMLSFAAVNAMTPRAPHAPQPRIVSATAEGQPIILARMVVRDGPQTN